MSTPLTIGNKTTNLPGVYSQIQSGIKNPVQATSYGNICIVDKGLGAGYMGGAGVAGNQLNGKNAIYEFTDIFQFQSFCRGGIMWNLAKYLFLPGGVNNFSIRGVSKLFVIKAAATTPATCTLSLSATTLTIKTRDEGLCANGTLVSGNLTKGYSVVLNLDTFSNKYFLSFYVGTYKGIDPDTSLPYDNVAASESTPQLVLNTGTFTSIAELMTWIRQSTAFNAMFSATTAAAGTTAVTTLEAAAIVGHQVFSGATETYSNTHYDNTFQHLVEIDNSLFLTLDSGADSQSAYNTKLLYHIVNDARFEKLMIVGAGSTSGEFKGASTASIETAQFYDTDSVIVVHGGFKERVPGAAGFITRNSLYTSALVAGRIAGLEPQTPITFKRMNMMGLTHLLAKQEKEYGLTNGLFMIQDDPEIGFCVVQGVNSLQRNTVLVNEDATSHDIAVKRIVMQLNKEIVINAKKVFFGKEVGLNRGTATPEDIISWLTGFLDSKVASSNQDNLIIRYEGIQVRVDSDTYFVDYRFVPNYPINKLVFTGTIISE